MKKSIFGFLPYFFWSLLFVAAPTIIVFCFAFLNEEYKFTLENILRISKYVKIILKTLLITTSSTLLCLLIAYPFSYFLCKVKNELYKKIFIILVTLPMWTNLLLRTYSWMSILENNGLINKMLNFFNISPIRIINTPFAIIIVMAYDFLPFMILPIYNAINKIDRNLIEASEDLGANELQTFKFIIFPLSAHGIFSGASIVFVSCACSFLIPRLLGGGCNILMGELIESQFMGTIYNPWFGCALATFFMFIIIIIISITNKLGKNKAENFSI